MSNIHRRAQGTRSSESLSQNVSHGSRIQCPQRSSLIVYSHPSTENQRDILQVEASHHPSVVCLRGASPRLSHVGMFETYRRSR